MSEDSFRLQVESHPETQLLQTLHLGLQHTVQVVSLFDKIYLIERYKAERMPPLRLDEPALLKQLYTTGKLEAEALRPLLPPRQSASIDFLIDDQSSSTAPEASEQNEATTAPAAGAGHDPLQALLYQAMSRFARQSEANVAPAPDNAESQPPAATDAASIADPAQPAISAERPPIQLLTAPLVQEALQNALEQQQQRLEQSQQLHQQLQNQTTEVRQAFDTLPHMQARMDHLQAQLEQWQSDMERHHLTRDHLLAHTQQELSQMQQELQQLLADGLALQKVLREQRFPPQSQMDERLECLADMLDQVVQQRRWVHALQQRASYQALESSRLQLLQQRRQALREDIASLQAAIAQLEQINQEILTADPLCVPEPVPALALHELARLEQELQILNHDPALTEGEAP
ncbi:MAG: hypothetical protein IGS03_01775 [Candidatus Sericytochromatia bacterium]|nr:hypothetical protein [Candidatus Sericytochromatia bacterium]